MEKKMIKKNKMTWEELVNQKVLEEPDLQRTYKDTSSDTSYTFRVSRVRPFGYKTFPVTVDYDLFVDLEKTQNVTQGTRKDEIFREISLGNTFNEGPRKFIPFGREYFKDTSRTLMDILSRGWEEAWK